MHQGSPLPFRPGHPLFHFEEVVSTNSLLWKLVEEGAKPGTAVVADYQRGGKGQAGARWESEAGANILLSLYLPVPFLEATVQFRLNMAVALAVSDFARLYLGDGVLLKWPNDLFYQKTKLGGILIENSIQGSRLADSVVGVGINVNQTHFFGPFSATSFSNITGRFYALHDLLEQLFACFEKRFEALYAGQWMQQRSDYLQQLLGLGEQRSFEYQGQIIKATMVDVDAEGHLILDSSLGRLVMNNKEIKFRFDER